MASDRQPPAARTPQQRAFDALTVRTFAVVLALIAVTTLWLGPATAVARIVRAL